MTAVRRKSIALHCIAMLFRLTAVNEARVSQPEHTYASRRAYLVQSFDGADDHVMCALDINFITQRKHTHTHTHTDRQTERERDDMSDIEQCNAGPNKFVRPPRWPYDMRPSARAEKYIRDAGP